MKTPFDRGGLRFFLVLAALIRGLSSGAAILAGVPFILLGTALHFWAKGCLRQNRVLALGGPYRFVRHPFYLANALIDAGVAVMSGWWLIQVVLPFWWLAVYLPVMRKEENYLAGVFGAAYEEYKRRTPRLIPWRRPLPRGGEGFHWSNPNIATGDEIGRALRLLAYPLLFFVCMNLRNERLSSLAQPWNLSALGLLAVLHGLAWWARRPRVKAAADTPPNSPSAP
jgi:protein-S-isoprenylcysteine O-methyltransferase Ste14